MSFTRELRAKFTAGAEGFIREVKAMNKEISTIGTETEKSTDKSNKALSGFKSGLEKVGKVAITVGATIATALGATAVKSIHSFVGFEEKMNEVFTLLPEASEEAMEKMTKDVKGFSKEMGVLPNETIPALYQSISAGVPVDNVFKFLETATKASIGGVTSLEVAVDGITSVVNAYGAEVMDANKASDLMFTAVRKGKTTFGELAQSLYNVIPTASALEVEFGDITASLATMTAQGTPTSVATTQLRQALVELSKEGGKADKTFRQLAGKGFKEFIAEGNNLQDALQLMEGHAGKLGISVNNLFSSVEAGNAVLALTGKGTEMFTENLLEMQNSAGATDMAFNRMEQGIGRSFKKIRASSEVMLLNLSDQLMPTVELMVDWVIDNMPRIEALISKGFEVFGTMIMFVVNIMQNYLFPILDRFLTWWEEDFSVVVDKIKDNKDKIVDYIQAIGIVISIVLIPKMIAMGVQATIAMTKNVVAWATMSASAVKSALVMAGQFYLMIGKWVLLGAQATIHALKVAGAWVIAMGPIGWAITAIVGFVALLIANWDKVKEATEKMGEALTGIFNNLVDSAKQWGTNLIDMFVSGINERVEKVKDAVGNVANTIKNFLGFGSPTKEGAGADSDKWAPNFMTMFENGIREHTPKVKDASDKVADAVATGLKKVQDFTKATVDIISKEFDLWILKNSHLEGSSEALQKKLDMQREKHSLLTAEIEVTEEALVKIIAKYGEGSAEALKYKNALLDLQIEQQKLTNEIEKTTEALKRQSSQMSQVGKIHGSGNSVYTITADGGARLVKDGKLTIFDAQGNQRVIDAPSDSEVRAVAERQGVTMDVARSMARTNAELGIEKYGWGTKFAKGGLSLIGERGAELMNVPRGSQILPHNKLNDIFNIGDGLISKLIDAITDIKPSVNLDVDIHSPEPLTERKVRSEQEKLLKELSLEWGLR